MIRIVIDPNVIASVLPGGVTRRRYEWLLKNIHRFDLCYSDTVIDEVENLSEVAHFIKKGVSGKEIEGFLEIFRSYALKVLVTSRVRLGRDKNDYYLLSLSRDARASFLITGDPDLLEIKKYGTTQIISMKDFFEKFQND